MSGDFWLCPCCKQWRPTSLAICPLYKAQTEAEAAKAKMTEEELNRRIDRL